MKTQEIKTVRTNGYSCDQFKIEYLSDSFNGKILDTRVVLVTGDSVTTLFWIAGNDIQKFDTELTELINKHRI